MILLDELWTANQANTKIKISFLKIDVAIFGLKRKIDDLAQGGWRW